MYFANREFVTRSWQWESLGVDDVLVHGVAETQSFLN